MTTAHQLRTKRVYAPADDDDGLRVLVDRLWPRGVSKADADLDEWLKDIAPSPQLRTWWNHDPERIDEFATRYTAELDDNPAVGRLRELMDQNQVVTLVYGARDPQINHAEVLREYLSA